MPTSDTSQFLTLREFSELARVHINTARRYVASGQLPARRVGPRKLLVSQADARAFLGEPQADDATNGR